MRSLSRIALVLGVAVCLSTQAQQIQVNKDNKTIAITTSASASALADVAVVRVGFDAYGKEHDALYDESSRTSNAIYNALLAAGVPKESIQSGSQSIGPLASSGEQEKARYAQGIRFYFAQSWLVTVPAAQAANVLNVAITNGANQSGDISWQMRDEDTLQAQAAGKALAHARQIATSMADGLHAKLGSLVYAANQSPSYANNFMGPNGFVAGMSMGSAGSAGPVRYKTAPLAIAPARISRSATVYAVFAIE